jgi:hypothetical protein
MGRLRILAQAYPAQTAKTSLRTRRDRRYGPPLTACPPPVPPTRMQAGKGDPMLALQISIRRELAYHNHQDGRPRILAHHLHTARS